MKCPCEKGDKVEHPKKGKGIVSKVEVLNDDVNVFVEWANPAHSIKGPEKFNSARLQTLVFEKEYADEEDVKELVDDEDDEIEIDETSEYLNRPLRSLEQAKKDREQSDKDHGLTGGRGEDGELLNPRKKKAVAESLTFADLMESDPLASMPGADSFKEPNLLAFKQPSDALSDPKVLDIAPSKKNNKQSNSTPKTEAPKETGPKEGPTSPAPVGEPSKKAAPKMEAPKDEAPKGDEPSKPKAPKEVNTNKPETNGSSEGKKKTFETMSSNIAMADLDFDSSAKDDFSEHEMGEGEINVTIEFMTKLLTAVAAQKPDDSKIEYTVKALSAMGSEPLGVDSIPSVMAKIKELAGSIEECGDGEPAGPEGGKEHEGKTKLMSGDL